MTKGKPATSKKARHELRERAATRRRRTINWGILGLAFVAIAGFAIFSAQRGPSGGERGSGDPKAWDLPSLKGEGRVKLSDFEGQPLVVNFFASWCESCRFELPGFKKVSEELKGTVAFVGVNSLDDGNGMPMAREFGIESWPLAVDLGSGDVGELHDRLGARGMPATAFYDEEGRLVDFIGGAISERALRSKLRELYSIEI